MCFPTPRYIEMGRTYMKPEQKMRQQYGLITREQALAAGLTNSRVNYLLRSQQWRALHRGVFAHAGTPSTTRQRVMAATLASGGVASHRTVVSLLGLGNGSSGRIEVTTDHTRPKKQLPGVATHRSTQWEARQQTDFFGISCTGIERTIMDVAGAVSVNRVERIAEEAVRRRQTSFQQLARFLVLHGKQGRTGSANFRSMLMRRDPQAALPLSDFSRAVHQLILRSDLPPPVLEFPIYDRDGSFIMRTDIAWPEQRKAVELDGLAWHFGRDDVERDRRKRARARAEGWRIQEVLWSMYRDDRTALARQIADFLAS